VSRISFRAIAAKVSAIDAAGAGACLVVTLAAYFLIAAPALSRRSRTAFEWKSASADKRELAATNAAVRSATARVGDLRNTIAKKSIRLVPEDQLNGELARVSTLAAESGLSTEDVRPGAVLAGPKYDVLPFRICGRGRYQDCVRFIHRLRIQDPDMGVGAIRLSVSDGQGQAAFAITLRWFTTSASAGRKAETISSR
jgi:hypothetical protein